MSNKPDTAACPRNTALTAALEAVDASREAYRKEQERQACKLAAIEQELSEIPSIKKRLLQLERKVGHDAGVFDPSTLGNGPRDSSGAVRGGESRDA